MIDKNHKNNKIFNEFDLDNQNYWFDFKQQKYLHNIDTYYYSVRIQADEFDWIKFINVLEEDKKNSKLGLSVSTFSSRYVCNGYTFGIYKYDIELPDEFLILIAENVPNENTPQIIVQLRSYYIWLHGINKAIEYSYQELESILQEYNIRIFDVKSNRIDFCWHTNYIQDLDTFFNPLNIAKMRVSRFDTADMHFKFRGEEDIEYDYIRLGRLKSNNILFRAYLKSKEVVEMGYKPWFFKIWLFNGLINRYDNFVYEECFRKNSWEYLDKARLKFYYEYGVDQTIKNRIAAVLNEQNGTGINNYDDLKKFADELTPKINYIINFEYQTMRKFYSSIDFLNIRNRKGKLAGILTELDYRKLINEYLTNDTLRFVEKNGDTNKSRRNYAPFWAKLRQTKIVDAVVPPENIKLIRVYKTNLNRELMKQRILNSIATYNVYKANISDNIYNNFSEVLNGLNDNDLYRMKMYRNKKIHLLSSQIELGEPEHKDTHSIAIVDKMTGTLLS